MAHKTTTRKKTTKPEQRGWSVTSRQNMMSCHPDLVRVLNAALQTSPHDFRVICGHRGKEAQNEAYDSGNSKVRFPHSKHNSYPSRAFDFIPLPLDWENLEMFVEVGQHFEAVAAEMGIDLRWGGDWDRDGDWKDERFFDGGHVELM